MTESSEKNKSQEVADRNLQQAIEQIRKEFGQAAIMRLGDKSCGAVEVIPTGNLAIDTALGVGGFPRGRIIEVFGPESSGKTTLALTLAARAQARGGIAAIIDVEHALDPRYAKKIGLKVKELLISQPSSGEEALRICESLLRSEAVDIVILDSVAALVTRQELSGEIGDATMGAQARLMSQAMRKLASLVSKANAVCLFTNQIREKVGVIFGSPEITPGGRALKFFSSIRVDIRRIGQIKTAEGRVLGNRTRIKIVKNKVAPPFREAEFDIYYDEGISITTTLLDYGIQFGLIEKRGSWFSYEGKQLGQGRDAVREVFSADKALTKTLTKLIQAKIKEQE